MPTATAGATDAASCRSCGTQVAPALLSCPGCGTLTHGAALNALAERAGEDERAGELARAAATWREALALLPASAPQRAAVVARVDDLTRRIDAAPAAPPPSRGGRAGANRGVWGTISAAALLLLTKAKLLLLGLTKVSTLFSMLAFLGVYWKLYGWALGAGIVASIYVHEMGHVAALARYGISAGAPMFIPGLGAFVRLKQSPASAREDAVVGLAGPLWGLGAAAAAYAMFAATGRGVWAAIAGLGALINLFNLTPVWQLDGARGFRALSRRQRWAVAAACAAAALVSTQGILWIVALVGAYRAFESKDAPATGDPRLFATFVGLVAAHAAIVVATASAAHVR